MLIIPFVDIVTVLLCMRVKHNESCSVDNRAVEVALRQSAM